MARIPRTAPGVVTIRKPLCLNRYAVFVQTRVSCCRFLSLAAPLWAQAPPVFKPEGRPTAGIQVGTPTLDAGAGVTFERDRIKRTPQLLPKTALSESRWDLLYNVTEANGRKAVYFDWDDNNIYFAWELPAPEAVRFDLDGASDGFLRGADNIQVQVQSPISLDPMLFQPRFP